MRQSELFRFRASGVVVFHCRRLVAEASSRRGIKMHHLKFERLVVFLFSVSFYAGATS